MAARRLAERRMDAHPLFGGANALKRREGQVTALLFTTRGSKMYTSRKCGPFADVTTQRLRHDPAP